MEWNVIYNDSNAKEIRAMNIFRHGGFRKDVDKYLVKCKTKEELAEELRKSLMYYFWSRCEYEVIVSPWPVGQYDRKIDIYWQVMNNWDIFVDYVWRSKYGANS